ncbi:MAG: glucose 1-dehydrogenase [Pseudomonadota bacterium]|nr:glucose 1-dehydrogenase [Pseudomonadota bacterium]
MTTLALQGHKALVTGASSGIGAAVAKALAQAGAAVLVNYHSDEKGAAAVVEAIVKGGGEAFAFQADVADEAAVQAMFAEACKRFGTVHILVSNAGIQQDAPLLDMTLRQWEAVIATNLTGAFLCARAAAREFCRRGVDPAVSKAAGKIVFTSSVHEVIPWAGRVNYAASKGGLMLLMQSIAQELAPHKIRVNSVAPGATKTEINRESWDTPEKKAGLIRLIPYGRVGEPDDVAHAVVWLASDASDYVTGASLPVDGGMLLYPAFREGG